MRRRPASHDFSRDQSGVAAVELAITLPFLLLLFFGLINVADYMSRKSRLATATALVGDLVARNDAVVSRRDIEDYFTAAGLLLGAAPGSGVTIDVRALRKTGGVLADTPQWSRSWGGGACAPSGLKPLQDATGDGHDIIVAVSCMTYEPPVASFLGTDILGFASSTLRQQMAMAPHRSATLSCNDC
jgi:Flp pilus assembly protein TadG